MPCEIRRKRWGEPDSSTNCERQSGSADGILPFSRAEQTRILYGARSFSCPKFFAADCETKLAALYASYFAPSPVVVPPRCVPSLDTHRAAYLTRWIGSTHSRLQLIRSLKDELVEMKKKAVANQKLMLDISHVRRKEMRAWYLC